YLRDLTLHFRFIDIHLLFRSESASIGLFRALSLGRTPLVTGHSLLKIIMEDLQCGVPGRVHSWEGLLSLRRRWASWQKSPTRPTAAGPEDESHSPGALPQRMLT